MPVFRIYFYRVQREVTTTTVVAYDEEAAWLEGKRLLRQDYNLFDTAEYDGNEEGVEDIEEIQDYEEDEEYYSF